MLVAISLLVISMPPLLTHQHPSHNPNVVLFGHAMFLSYLYTYIHQKTLISKSLPNPDGMLMCVAARTENDFNLFIKESPLFNKSYPVFDKVVKFRFNQVGKLLLLLHLCFSFSFFCSFIRSVLIRICCNYLLFPLY